MLTHLDSKNQPQMVDVSDKAVTQRRAVAQSKVVLTEEIMKQLQGDDIVTRKGAVFQTAIIAGIMAAKKTSELIPLCHILPLDKVNIQINPIENNTVLIECEAKATHRTGVEMEALTGATIAALTVYDMCKAMSHDIRIEDTRLLTKSGGKKDFNS